MTNTASTRDRLDAEHCLNCGEPNEAGLKVSTKTPAGWLEHRICAECANLAMSGEQLDDRRIVEGLMAMTEG